jgi:hypothetical protein
MGAEFAIGTGASTPQDRVEFVGSTHHDSRADRMTTLTDRAVELVTVAADVSFAVGSALWPRSQASRERDRLVNEGYEDGAFCELDFTLAFPDAAGAGQALEAVRAAGFTMEQRLDARGFAVVRAAARLRPYDLSRIVARLNRIVQGYGGFAEVVGPSSPATATGANRVANRASNAVTTGEHATRRAS